MILGLLLLLPFVGAALCVAVKRDHALLLSLGTIALFMVGAVAATLLPTAAVDATTWFALDSLSRTLLPVFALLHLLCLLGAAKTVTSVAYCARMLLATGLSSLALTTHNTHVLLIILIVSIGLPLWELAERQRNSRVFEIYMLAFVAFLLAGISAGIAENTTLAGMLLLIALLIRSGIVPAHSWLPVLFNNASYGSALAFTLPLVEMLAIIRLLLNDLPAQWLEIGSALCLASAVYGAGLAMVQQQVSRFFAYLCMSQTSLVLYALLLHTPNGVTAALCLWFSALIALGGLAFSIRALESRFGAMSLNEFHGHYEQVPGLAALFLITGLASIGFPGTVGFVPMELLFSGSYEEGLWVSATLALATMFNGIALIRAYFSLFTGKTQRASIALSATWRERAGIVLITLVIFGAAWLTPSVVESRHSTAEQLLGTSSEQHALR